jgi:hypothetical protein
MKVLGLTGVARSGKDTFCAVARKIMTERGLRVQRFALADDLKSDVDAFLLDKFGISAWTSDPENKTIIRPFLVWYGGVQRKRSNGTYWTSRVTKKINESDADVAIVTDVRYDVFPHDEIQWLQQTMGGKLVHVSKYTWGVNWAGDPSKPINSDSPQDYRRVRIFVEAPNEDERNNDPKLKAKADYRIEWEHQTVSSEAELVNHPGLNEVVGKALRELGFID